MAGLPREDFPTLPEGKAGKGIEIPAEVLRALITRTAFAITAEDARYYLAGRAPRARQGRRGRWWPPTVTGWPTPSGRCRSS